MTPEEVLLLGDELFDPGPGERVHLYSHVDRGVRVVELFVSRSRSKRIIPEAKRTKRRYATTLARGRSLARGLSRLADRLRKELGG